MLSPPAAVERVVTADRKLGTSVADKVIAEPIAGGAEGAPIVTCR
jgi:hypothetical protein